MSWLIVPPAKVTILSFRILVGDPGVLWQETPGPKLFQKGQLFCSRDIPWICGWASTNLTGVNPPKGAFYEMSLSDGSQAGFFTLGNSGTSQSSMFTHLGSCLMLWQPGQITQCSGWCPSPFSTTAAAFLGYLPGMPFVIHLSFPSPHPASKLTYPVSISVKPAIRYMASYIGAWQSNLYSSVLD